MSFLFNTVKDYISAPSSNVNSTNNTESNDHEDTKESLPSINPYSAASNANNKRIIVDSPFPATLTVPSVSLNSLQPPTISTEGSDEDSDNDSEAKLATPYLTPSTAPSMTLSTAEAPDEATPSFPAMNGPQRLAACSTDPKSKRRIKFALAPGHSALDWARLTNSGTNLSGVSGMGRFTLSDVKGHNKADDAWTVLNGKVYNITPYLPFHPGGEKELLRCAGRDGTRLFILTLRRSRTTDFSNTRKRNKMTVQNIPKYPSKMPSAIFLDSGGVINDNSQRAPQWVRYLGEFFPATVLGGNSQIWGQANIQIVKPFFSRWQSLMEQAIETASKAQTKAIDQERMDREWIESGQDRDMNVYFIFERIQLLVWIKEMCKAASPHIPELETKILPGLTDDDLFEIAKSAYLYSIQRVKADFPGAVDTIRRLSTKTKGSDITTTTSTMQFKHKLYTSSGDCSEDLEYILKGLGVFDCFDDIYGSDSINCLKTSQRFYEKVFERVRVRVISRDNKNNNSKNDSDSESNKDGDEVVVLDDSIKALKWARAVGARTVLVTPEELDLSLKEYEHIDYQIKGLFELPDLLESWREHLDRLSL
ncbi:hypothetical protein BGZ46_008044 [Entomortierella lignicola]|nr:hypothetical protein BGZ46_008044 [Entomortierella lignicola]